MQATFEAEGRIKTAQLYVTKGNVFICYHLKHHEDLELIPVVNILESSSVNDLCNKYMSVFVGNGKLKHTQIDLM